MRDKLQRIFVGNIPPGVSDTDLKQEFASYGTVQYVDLKTKENLVNPENPNNFAFISLNISDQMIKTCIAEFSSAQYRGRYLTVSVARESFLDRLKREREENAKNRPQQTEIQVDAVAKKNTVVARLNGSSMKILPIKPKLKVSSSESSDSSEADESSDEDEKPANNHDAKKVDDFHAGFISKKNASASLRNGKIQIQCVSAEPIHVISRKSKEIRHLEGSAQQSDQKRKESLHKMKNQYNQQKLAIQQALSSVDTGKRNKIIFESADTVEEEHVSSNQNKTDLFVGDDDADEDEHFDYGKDFEVKTQFQGKDGEKLMKLQSKFKLDPRFAMSSQFLDENSEVCDKTEKRAKNDEREWQLGIIEQVFGRKLESMPDPNRKKIKNRMTRFDPSKEEHKQFYKTRDEDEQQTAVNKKSAISDANDVEVSKEQFYKVSEDLTKSLRRRGDGFSLLSMFSLAQDRQDGDIKFPLYNEKPLMKSKSDAALNNPFKFDSSDSENENEQDVAIKSTKNSEIVENPERKTIKVAAAGGKVNKTGIWAENFFIFNVDQRFEDGSNFFKVNQRPNADDEPPQDYDEIKRNLRNIIQRKIVKKRKNVDGFKTRASKFKKRK